MKRMLAALAPGVVAFAGRREVQCNSEVLQESRGLMPGKVPESVSLKAKQLFDERFRKGNYWVWLYRSPSGQPYSWERYSVCSSGPDDLVIEMSSRFSDTEDYSVHHRMRLSLGESLAAKYYHKAWQFRDFCFKQDGKWCEAPFKDNVQAFEEKFNVFLMADARVQASEVKPDAAVMPGDTWPTELVRTKRQEYTKAWYAGHSHRHSGLAAFKEFTDEHQEDHRSYSFELIEVGTTDESTEEAKTETSSHHS